jgi:dihydroorotase-like cyclic amidohydrolase
MRATHLTHLISYFSSKIVREDETQLLVTVSVQMHHLCLGQNIYFSAFIDGWLLIAAY